MTWEPVIGLEVHAQLLTRSKMFCGCSADYVNAAPNGNVCQVCAGMPGVLPVINTQAVRYTAMTALALHCTVAEFSKFDRKNYFYPDLPKGYQISQYDLPIGRHGYLYVDLESGLKRIGITRVHLEEDTGKSTHDDAYSLVDFNRCGIPLMEIVSEPDMRSAEEARLYFMQLRNLLLYLGVNNGNLSTGSLRCDANVSVRPAGSAAFGTKVEIKNMNSFRSVKLAIDYEIARQIKELEAGGTIVQETRGWNEDDRCTVSQRSKEFAEDYRYFPEPDLPPLDLEPAWIAEVAAGLPEMADARADRFARSFGLAHGDAAQLASSRTLADLFEETAVLAPGQERAASNWLLNEFRRLLGEDGVEAEDQQTVRPAGIASIIRMVESRTINSTAAKRVFEEYYRGGEDPEAIVRRLGLQQVSDRATLEPAAQRAIEASPKVVADYRRGKVAALQNLKGAVMKEFKGAANANAVEELLRELLAEE